MLHRAGEAAVAETTLVVSRADVSGDLVHGTRPRRRAAQSVAHRAGELRAAAKSKGEPLDGKPELLFVCVQNAGRSQIAAAMAKHFSGGRVNVRSAGSRPSGQINPEALKVLKDRGIEATYLFSKPLTDDALQASDVVITMGCGDECPYCPGKRYEDWALDDPNGQPIETVRRIADEIEERIKILLADLGVA